LVQFKDGSMKAQMGLPDMKLPIQYALGFPKRMANNFPRFNFLDYPQLTFEAADLSTFRNLQFAFDALEKGGNSPCVLNAANEVAVALFLDDKISFLGMSDLIESVMAQVKHIAKPTLEDLFWSDTEARRVANLGA
jgi:1-deoxy-D-xylulose-5-phosphate reductoisomerase